MLFPTIGFAFFFALVFAVNWLLRGCNPWRKVFLVVASYFFYGCWDWRFTFLLAGCSLAAWAFGCWLGWATTGRRIILGLGLALNLLLLSFFKYSGFILSSLADLSLGIGLNLQLPVFKPLLPVGISFVTFHAISYLVDVYRGDVAASRSLVDVLLYMAFFPLLIAGPIARARLFLPQLERPADPSGIPAARALGLIALGLFKKVVITTYLAAQVVDPVFDVPLAYGTFDVIAAVAGYAVQIFCDFSAYSDMAIGIALLLGFTVPDNFKAPYRSLSLNEFWHRWHISLSYWLRDYVYIPLGGSKRGPLRTYANLLLTMFLGGLWHGAAWTFAAWGLLHGAGLAVERAIARRLEPLRRIHALVPAFLLFTFCYVCLGWILFRASSFSTALDCLRSLVNVAPPRTITPLALALMAIGLGLNFVPGSWPGTIQRAFGRLPVVLQGATFGLTVLAISLMGPGGVAPFIYFQF
jgi:D-alanyl-lipoteichoic acid acyltransferase DltB (MBOAT superfamily)